MSSRVKQVNFDWIIENVTREKLENPNFNAASNVFFIDFFGTLLECQMNFSRIRTEYLDDLALIVKFKGIEEMTFFSKMSYDFDSETSGWMEDELKMCRSTNSLFMVLSNDNPDGEDETLDFIMNFVDEKSTIKIRIGLTLREKEAIGESQTKNATLKSYGDTTFADFTLESSDGEKFPIHRNTLAFTSTYFYKLFTTDMKEKQLKIATFDDVDSKTLKEVLKFIYTGKVQIDGYEFAKDILYAAEKFALEDLKEVSIRKLISEISDQNVLDALDTAELFNAKDLKQMCLNRIMSKFEVFEGQLSEDTAPAKMAIMLEGAKWFKAAKNDPQFIVKTTL